MKLSSRSLVGIMAVLVVTAPLTLLVTFLLYPLRSWLDVIAGVKSLGHSAPAISRYELVYLVLVIVGIRYVLRKRLAGS